MVLSNSTSGTDATTSQKGQYELSTEELARGAKMVLHLRDGLSTLQSNRKASIRSQRFHPRSLTIAKKADGTARTVGRHLHRHAHGCRRRDTFGGRQLQSSNAYVPAELQFGGYPPQSRSSGRRETEGRIGDTFALSNGAFGNCESTAWRDPAVDETEQQISKEHGTDGRAHPCQIALEGHLHPVVKRISPETPVRSETAVQA